MSFFDELKSEGLSRIRQFIQDEQEEIQDIEFKMTSELDNKGKLSKSAKRSLSKQITGMANGIGGVIVFGIETGKKREIDYAKNLRPIRNLEKFSQLIKNGISQFSSSPIDGIECLVITEEGETNSGYLVVHVPFSNLRPHMATAPDERRYYRRNMYGTFPMDHQQIKEMFLASTSAILKPELKFGIGSSGNYIEMKMIIAIRNIGRIMAKNPFVRVIYPEPFPDMAKAATFHRRIDLTVNYHLPNNPVVHSGELAVFNQTGFYVYCNHEELLNLNLKSQKEPWLKKESWTISPQDFRYDPQSHVTHTKKKYEFVLEYGAENAGVQTTTFTLSRKNVVKFLCKNYPEKLLNISKSVIRAK